MNSTSQNNTAFVDTGVSDNYLRPDAPYIPTTNEKQPIIVGEPTLAVADTPVSPMTSAGFKVNIPQPLSPQDALPQPLAPKFDIIASGAVNSTVNPDIPQASKFQVSLPQPCSGKASNSPSDKVAA